MFWKAFARKGETGFRWPSQSDRLAATRNSYNPASRGGWMKLKPPWDHRRRVNLDDQALPLINVAFLLLVFFLMAGTLLLPEPFTLQHLQVKHGETGRPEPQMLAVARDGRMAYRGQIVDQSELMPSTFADLQGPLAVRVDARVDAQRVVDLLRHLRAVGVARIRLVGVKDAAR